MNFCFLLGAILAFSTSIDAVNNVNCYTRPKGDSGEGASEACDKDSNTCIAYYDADGDNIGACVPTTGACTGKTGCKECASANCNQRSLILQCYLRADSSATGEGTIDTQCSRTPSNAKCVSYYDASGNNLGNCLDRGCGHNDISSITSLHCKDCTTNNCNVRSLIRKCYVRNTGTTSGEGTSTNCDTAMADPKCVSYYDGSGNNLGKCLDGGCTEGTVSSLHCKDCLTDNCNVRSLIRKCYVRITSTTSGDGTSTNCATTITDPKCVSYYNADGNNIGECKDGGCGSQANCQECTGDNCNVRSLVTTTTAGPITTADAGAAETTLLATATRASVGWLTGIMAASACVLALMKPF